MIEIEQINQNTVVVIAGPTASGKSALALEIAEKYNGVVINADASQIYKGIPIISAAPTLEDKTRAEHVLYEIFEPEKNGSVADWLPLAVDAVRQSQTERRLPIVVGGTGFYIEALVKGASPIPETKAEVKRQVAQIIEQGGTSTLYEMLARVDIKGAQMVHKNDTTRVRRALEIFLDTKKSIAEWFNEPFKPSLPTADFHIIAKLPPLTDLEQKCGQRFESMLEAGALGEAERLLARGLNENLPVMKAIGVPELCAYLKGDISLKKAADLAKLHTRQYAKRQLTWFRNRLFKLDVDIVKA